MTVFTSAITWVLISMPIYGLCMPDPLDDLTININIDDKPKGMRGKSLCRSLPMGPKFNGIKSPMELSDLFDDYTLQEAPQTPKTGTCGEENETGSDYISGGSETGANQYPRMVRLPEGCGGSLITDRHILTALHCVKEVSGRDTKFNNPATATAFWKGQMVKVGVHNQDDPNDYLEVPIKEVQWPDGWFARGHDIAIIVLATPVNLNDRTIGTVCLPANNHEDYRGENAIAMGWGMTAFGSDQSPVLKHVQLKVTQRQEKNWLFTEVPVINGVHQDACAGDSGGPLVHKDSGTDRWTIIGTRFSNGYSCKTGKLSGKYGGEWNKVTDHLVWINNVISH